MKRRKEKLHIYATGFDFIAEDAKNKINYYFCNINVKDTIQIT